MSIDEHEAVVVARQGDDAFELGRRTGAAACATRACPCVASPTAGRRRSLRPDARRDRGAGTRLAGRLRPFFHVMKWLWTPSGNGRRLRFGDAVVDDQHVGTPAAFLFLIPVDAVVDQFVLAAGVAHFGVDACVAQQQLEEFGVRPVEARRAARHDQRHRVADDEHAPQAGVGRDRLRARGGGCAHGSSPTVSRARRQHRSRRRPTASTIAVRRRHV